MSDHRATSDRRIGPTAARCLLPVLCAVAGCMTFGPVRNGGGDAGEPKLISQSPDPKGVIGYVNANAALINSLECNDLSIEFKAGSQQVGAGGSLHCQKPRNFRLRVKAIGQEFADVGSNEQEFWFWNKEERPPGQYYCSYEAFNRGNVPLPFPVRPEWVLEVLGMATLDPKANVTIPRFGDSRDPSKPPRTFELVERTTGPGGRPVTKVTVFNNVNATRDVPQIAEYRLYDGQNQLMCGARVDSVRRVTVGPGGEVAAVPYKLVLHFPAQRPNPAMTLTLKLDGLRVNSPDSDVARNPRLYQRMPMRDVPSYDLARGLPSAPTGFQRTRATGRE